MKRLFFLLALTVKAACYALSGEQVIENMEKCIRLSPGSVPKQQVADLLAQLQLQAFVSQLGGEELRPKFVDLQGCLEHVLAHMGGDIMGIILTPMPDSPLCTDAGYVDSTLLDPAMRNNQEALYTVRSRAATLRDYLGAGHVLYSMYPEGGLQKRTAAQQQIYLALVAQFPGKLFDTPLKTLSIDPAMVGATYFFQLEDALWVFSIESHEIDRAQSVAEWAVWLGPITQPSIFARVEKLFSYLEPLGFARPPGTR